MDNDWLEKLSKEQTRQLLSVIDLKVEHELLNNYLMNNKFTFCLSNCNMPFVVKNHSTSILIKLVEMIKNGELVYIDNTKQ